MKRGAEWKPTANVAFSPVPFKMLRVKNRAGREVVGGSDMGDYEGHYFDPWKRGDLVVVEHVSSYWMQGEGTKTSVSWFVGRRHTTPSAPTAKIDAGGRILTVERRSTLWRIPYRYQDGVAALIGHDFESREALEAAI